MARRLNPRHQEMVRDKIRASQLINALQDHVLKRKKMATSAVTAALGLLKKVVPDLSASTVTVQKAKVPSYADHLEESKAPASAELPHDTVQ